MTQSGWILIGAVVLGLVIVLYLLLLCPVECH